MNQSKLKYLFQKYIHSASQEEVDKFLLLIKDCSDEEILKLLEETFDESSTSEPFFSENESQKLLQAVFDNEEISRQENNIPVVSSKPLKQKQWSKYIAIAALLLIGITVGVLVYNNGQNHTTQLVNIDEAIKPGSDKATLELANGTMIDLTTDLEGNIFEKAGLVISKTKDGQIVYNAFGISKRNPNQSIAYNTIRTPKGGQFQIILPDGSKVWLNAASSLTYPEVFEGTERKVELQGEGYFDVAKNKNRPFKVLSRGQTVTVLGTQFNINSYNDEPLIKTTLVEGSVKITEDKRNSSVVLKPGQQALIDNSSNFRISDDNVENAIAWRKGFFRFQGAEIDQVMREISRWYNVDIEIEEKNKGLEFWGEIYRNASITDALEILSYFNLKYKVEQTNENKKITIF